MRLGMIVRMDDRGLGNMTHEAWLHLQPDRALVIDMGTHKGQFVQHADWYPGATVVQYDPRWATLTHLSRDSEYTRAVRGFLDGLDVVYSAETFYDPMIVRWALAHGTRTVLHAMPEFYRHDFPEATEVWAPTPWRLDMLPDDALVMPVPIATERFGPRAPRSGGRFLHVVGHQAVADRAGTRSVLRALRVLPRLDNPVECTMLTQDARMASIARVPNVRLRRVLRSDCAYWDLYDHGDVLLAPRRFGGLSLVHNEAAAAGLALVLSDTEPNRQTWPGVYVPTQPAGEVNAPSGPVEVVETDQRALADVIADLSRDADRVADLSAASLVWAMENSWDALAGRYLAAFHRLSPVGG